MVKRVEVLNERGCRGGGGICISTSVGLIFGSGWGGGSGGGRGRYFFVWFWLGLWWGLVHC